MKNIKISLDKVNGFIYVSDTMIDINKQRQDRMNKPDYSNKTYETGVQTQYYGISLHYEWGQWTICDSLGGENLTGSSRPTDEQVRQYRDDHLGEYQDHMSQF